MINIHPGSYLPLLMKMTGAFGGQQKGDLIAHAWDPANGVGTGPLSVVFVAPAAGMATISGYVYQAGFAVLGRPQAWQVSLNGAVVASGINPDDGSITRSHPATFSHKVSLNQGDVVVLAITEISGLGTFMGFDLKVDLR